MLALNLDESDVRALGPQLTQGIMSVSSFFSSVVSPASEQFTQSLTNYFGPKTVETAAMEAASVLVSLWSQAVASTQTFASDAVRQAASAFNLNAPSGPLRMTASNHFARFVQIGRVNSQVLISCSHLVPDQSSTRARSRWCCRRAILSRPKSGRCGFPPR